MTILPPQTQPTPGSQSTAMDLIKAAMRADNVLESGEEPSGAEAQDALVILNQMIDGWANDRLMIFTVTRQGPYNLTPGQQTYTLGPDPAGPPQNLSLVRPPKISRFGIISLTNAIQPLELPMAPLTYDQWAAIPVKNIQSALPLQIWDDGGFPFRTLSVWTIPNTQVQLVVYAWVPITQFKDFKTEYSFPPGYLECLKYNLAVRIAPEFGVEQLNPLVAALAAETKAKIEAFNAPELMLVCDTAVVSPDKQLYNYITDEPVRHY